MIFSILVVPPKTKITKWKKLSPQIIKARRFHYKISNKFFKMESLQLLPPFAIFLLGIIFFIWLRSFIQFFLSQEKLYLIYSFYVLINGLFFLNDEWINLTGVDLIGMEVEHRNLSFLSGPFLIGGYIIYYLFMMDFLQLKQLSPSLESLLRKFLNLFVILLFVELGSHLFLTEVAFTLVRKIVLITIMPIAFYSIYIVYRLNTKLAYIVTTGTLIYYLGSVIGFLRNVNPFFYSMINSPDEIITTKIGLLLELLFFSLGLSFRTNILREEKERTAKNYYKEQLQNSQLQLDLEKAQRFKEIDELKTKFYTNITHEFRTPLTLIMGMADSALQHFHENEKEAFEKAIALVKRNGAQLLHLVNQMLDLAKLEAGKLKVEPIQADVIIYLKYLVESYHSLAFAKSITLIQNHQMPQLVMDYDADKIQKIIANLLSNAIKFTNEGGRVEIRSKQISNQLIIEIEDNGVGISKDELLLIFDRFYQNKSHQYQGTGIGLSLTKELVKLLDGKIEVKSRKGNGTCFTIALPITKKAKLETAILQPLSTTFDAIDLEYNNMLSRHESTVNNSNIEKPILLIVEDNQEVAYYIASCLEKAYQLFFAQDGAEGIEKAIELIPDFIISDVMMPKKDGYELCKTLKHDQRTSHIPIILLTAKADTTSKLQGLKTGADAYLTKPFQKEELLIRIVEMIKLRHQLQEKYRDWNFHLATASKKKKFAIQEKEISFLNQLHQILSRELQNSELDVQLLCFQMTMSRSQLHRKLKALTNQSTTQYIRNFRFLKAQELLSDSSLSIAEIAYTTGFNSPSYFSRMFTQEIGMSPSDYRATL